MRRMWQLSFENNPICQQINKALHNNWLDWPKCKYGNWNIRQIVFTSLPIIPKEQKFWPEFCTVYCNLEIKELILSPGPKTIGRVYQHRALPPDVCHNQWSDWHSGGVPFQSELQEYDLLDLWCDQGDQANNSSSFIPVLPIGPSQDFIETERYYLRLNWHLNSQLFKLF